MSPAMMTIGSSSRCAGCARTARPCGHGTVRRGIACRAVKVPEKQKKSVPPSSPLGENGADNLPGAPPPLAPEPRPVKPFVQVLGQKLLDTGDDVVLHAQRLFVKHKPVTGSFTKMPDGRRVYVSSKPIILVLGYGWASHAFSKVVDIEHYDVVVCSPRNHFVFTPMLPSTAVGSVEFRSVLEPVRAANPYVTYFEAAAEEVDLKNRTARCRTFNRTHTNIDGGTFEINYEYIFVAVGEEPATFGTPGVHEHCFFMKEVSDSVLLRKRLSEQFEMASFADSDEQKKAALRFVVVGGGPTGVEFAGTLSDFIFNEVKQIYPHLMEHTEVVLVQSAPKILPVFDAMLQKRAADTLETQKVRLLTNIKVVEVREKQIILSDGQGLPYGVCLWSTGNSSRPLTRDLVSQIPAQQKFVTRPASAKLAVDKYMRVIGAEHAFAAGDCSSIVGDSLPPTAQVAGQQGAYVARTINRNTEIPKGGLDSPAPNRMVEAAKDRQAEHEFDFLSLGIMAYIGRSRAVVEVDMDMHVDIWGKFAFLLWRSVYITKQVSMRNRVLILFDWLKTRVFGRDISLF